MVQRSFTDNALLLFVVAVFSALVLPALFMDGMFMDGVFYASISRNLAIGNGSLWEMYFSLTHHPQMHEQPPLMFVLQAGFFKLFGTGIYTERIYCTVTAILSSALVIRSWNLITRHIDKTKSSTANCPTALPIAIGMSTGWLPLLLWIIMPVTFYAFANNLEECTMVIFVLLAFNSILRAILRPTEKKIQWIIAGMWILAAGLTKGVQGMFLLSAPFWCWTILKNGTARDFVIRTLLIAVVPALFVLVAFITPEIRDSFDAYFTSRYGKTFSGTTASSSNHFHLLFELLLDTLPALAVMFLFLVAGRKSAAFAAHLKSIRKTILFVFVCALSGILPLLITREQRGFYLVTALPLVAIACGLVILPAALRFSAFVQRKKRLAQGILLTAFGISGLAAFLTIRNAGHPQRDAEKIQIVHEIASITGNGTTLHVTTTLNSDWQLICYFQRYHEVSITDDTNFPSSWFVCEKGAPVPTGYGKISLKSPLFDLYRKTDSTRHMGVYSPAH